MNYKKEIGQLFAVGFPGKEITPELKRLIHEYHISSVILFAHNIGTPKEVLHLTQSLQKEAKAAGYKYPLLIAVDEENGTVKRLGEGAGEYPGAMALSATQDANVAYQIAEATADDLIQLGINWNYAPVLDVNNNPENPVIGVRSFGEMPAVVSEFGIAFMKGLQAGGVATAVKHFPGHGDTHVDSHLSLPVIEHDIDRLREIELAPFKAAIARGADSVMTAHIVFPALEPEAGRPATLSKNILNGLLREELEFDGVVVTDALEMDAIAETIGIPNGALEAFKAGADQLLIAHYPKEQLAAINKVIEAVENKEISKERVQASLKRIESLKEKYLSWSNLSLENKTVPAAFNSDEKQQLAYEAYMNSVTVLKEGDRLSKDDAVLVLQPKDELRTIAEDTTEDHYILAQTVKKHIKKPDIEMITNDLPAEQQEIIRQKAEKADRIILGTMVAKANDDIVKLGKELSQRHLVDVISMKSPYVGQSIESANFWINTYEPSRIPLEIALKTLLGEEQPTGVSPVSLTEI